MYNLNLVKISFSLITSFSILCGSIYNCFEQYLPEFFKRFVKYGKLDNRKSKKNCMEVPKAWFKHFYVIALSLSIITFLLTTYVYVLGNRMPNWLSWYLNETVGLFRVATVAPANVLLALFLLLLQCCRRFYDTHYVSIFSKRCKMNISYYIIGHCHYFGIFTAILGEATSFAIAEEEDDDDLNKLKLSDIGYKNMVATLTFLWAWYHQYKSNVILASLRKNKKGDIVTDEHKLPRGDLFEYVTSPHLFTEKIMYICLSCILWGNSTFMYALAWVIVNQCQTALLSYWWYKSKFDNFPSNRKILIPFIY